MGRSHIRWRNILEERRAAQRGQVFVLTAVAMVAICAMAGAALDVGVWYQAHRKQQAVADAAALAAADSLPVSTSQATSDALAYAAKNGGSLSAGQVTFSTSYLPNDTVTVQAETTKPSYFLKVLGIGSADIKAAAAARAENLDIAWGSAPFGVINTQPELGGAGCPCYGVATTLVLDKVGPGGFEIINIDGSGGGTSPGILAAWVLDGCGCSTDTPVWLYSDPGAKFNSSQVKDAMDARIGANLLFPVYDETRGNGAGFDYHVIGFAGFHLTGYKFKGPGGEIYGSFVHVSWKGTGTANTSTYFGATTPRLVG